MVVDHAGRLHERVADGRADEPESRLLQRLAHRLGHRRGRGHLARLAPGVLTRPAVDEAPEEGLETRTRVAKREARAGVADRRLDLETIADDPRVGEQALDAPRAVACDPLRVEAVERAAVVLALGEDRVP